MSELCFNGHTRTEENTRWHKRGRGEQLKRTCLDCKREKRVNNGNPTAVDLSTQRTTELHENVEDLLRFGATFEEIVQRSGFSTWIGMRKSLNSRGRSDLVEQLTIKRGIKGNADLSTSPINGNKLTHGSFSRRGQRNRF